jgi:hypothetical protein
MAYTGSKYIEDDFLSIARGHVKGASHIHKFGAVPAMSRNQTGTVWDVDDTLYPWTAFDTSGVLTIPAVNAADNGVVVSVFGLDDNFDLVSENFTVSSSGTTTGTQTFKRVYRAFMSDGVTNVGNINIQRGGTTVARITAENGQTLMAIYTVPNGYTGYLLKGQMSCQAGADATGNMFVRYSGQSAFRIGHSFEVSGAGGAYDYDFSVPIQIPSKSDIDIRSSVRTNNARISSAFDIILFKGKR